MNREIAAVLPAGSYCGWGVCGENLFTALETLCNVKPLCPTGSGETFVDIPMLHTISGPHFKQWVPRVRSRSRNVGYCFMEDTEYLKNHIDHARSNYDHVVAGSDWLRDLLVQCGLDNVSSIPQGVNSTLFSPRQKRRLNDKFVILSGGKWEFRKSQDVVVKAFSIFAQRHTDAYLIGNWSNPWNWSAATMESAPHIRYRNSPDLTASIIDALVDAGIKQEQCAFLAHEAALQSDLTENFYSVGDVGLFPNRCEGGTNLVLMELQSCGRPAIASYAHGHKDVLDKDSPLALHSFKKLLVHGNEGEPRALWYEPSLEEVLAKLEWAYENRGELPRLGEKAREKMLEFSWMRAAESFLKVLTENREEIR